MNNKHTAADTDSTGLSVASGPYLVRGNRSYTTVIVFLFVVGSVAVGTPVVSGTSVAASGGTPASPATVTPVNDQGNAACDPPVSTRKRAKALKTLISNLGPSVVGQGPLRNVEKRISRGDTNFDLNRYCQAREAYESAIAIAEPTLKSAYAAEARKRLNEVDGMLAAEESDGNPDPNVGALRERHSRLNKELQNPGSLREHRSLYQRATQLKEDTESKLPTTSLEQFGEGITESRFVAGIAGLLFVVVLVETAYLFKIYRQDKGRNITIGRSD